MASSSTAPTLNQRSDAWTSRFGAILAVAGSAVGLGNFLRFPGLAATYGSGGFMIAYIISLLILGIPICWLEWTLGRRGGQAGFHSSPGIFHAIIKHPIGKYLGALGFLVPVAVYTYYVYIESWCAAYFVYFLTGKLSLGTEVEAYRAFWIHFVGMDHNGFGNDRFPVLLSLLIVGALNFVIIYRGISKGIETFCKWAMPTLILMALIVLGRVLTLGTPNLALPEQNVWNGLKFMWAPGEVAMQLKNPEMWLAAAGQILFSLSVGFGVIITYASYLRRDDDVVGSGLTAAGVNEFCEIGLGGMITVPAAFIFLGASGVAGQATFQLGFNVLPLVFSQMPMPWLFGAVFFLLLFFAAITSSISMLQPGIAYLEEGFHFGRGTALMVLALITGLGTAIVVYFSSELKALETIDFWVGTLGVFVMASVLVIVFAWVLDFDELWAEMHRGAAFNVPGIFKIITRWVAPLYLFAIFALWILFRVVGWNPSAGTFTPSGHISDIIGGNGSPASEGARGAVGYLLLLFSASLVSVKFAFRHRSKAR